MIVFVKMPSVAVVLLDEVNEADLYFATVGRMNELVERLYIMDDVIANLESLEAMENTIIQMQGLYELKEIMNEELKSLVLVYKSLSTLTVTPPIH